MNFWKNIGLVLDRGRHFILLCVIANEGSSPGKQGFKMIIDQNGAMHGSIGGGIMERKLVDLAKWHLTNKKAFQPFIKRQIHNGIAAVDRSGMICSGEQTVAFYLLDKEELLEIQKSLNLPEATIVFSHKGIEILTSYLSISENIIQTDQWNYAESLRPSHTAYIIGGGHVGLSLSRVLSNLDFYIRLFDDRDKLNTINLNQYVDEKYIIDYKDIGNYIANDENGFVILVSFGYRVDKLVLKQLIGRKFRYFGMMGSQSKIQALFDDLESEGIYRADLEKIYAPIGISKHNSSPEEIAISIAAQMIEFKNFKQ